MKKLAFFPSILLVTIFIALGCGGDGSSPVTAPPASPEMTSPARDVSASRNNRMLWGFWDISVDTRDGTVEAVPLRGAMFNANVTRFLQPPSSPVNLLSISINPNSNMQFGYVDLNVTIRHPYFGLQKFRGFDVRGIVMGEGTEAFSFDFTALRSGSGELDLLNADGYTRWWNPTEFTSYETILGYTRGYLSTPDYLASATVNAYKYFADDLEAETSIMDLDITTRGTFSTDPGINVRRYELQFPTMPGGGPVFHFNYAVDASWALPDPAYEPDYPVEAFPPEANTQEAWLVTVDDSESTAWYEDEDHNGGMLKLAIEVFDWQGMLTESTVEDEVSTIWFESDLAASPVEITSLALPAPAGPVSSVWNVEIGDLNLTSAGMFECWIGVEASHPENYAPQIEGDPNNFNWPDKPLTAYFRNYLQVSDENPNLPPMVLEVIPPSGVVSTVLTDVQVIGENFMDGAMLEFMHDSSETLDVSNLTWMDPTLMTFDLDCDGPLGFYDVTLTNPDLQFDTLVDGFEVLDDFQCEGSAHDWDERVYTLDGDIDTDFIRFDMAILPKGSRAGMAVYQMDYYNWGTFDPTGGNQAILQFFTTANSIYCVDIETCEATGRIAIINLSSDERIILFDAEGNRLDDFAPPDLEGNFTAIDFDRNGDLWAAVRTGPQSEPSQWNFELRHYAMLEDAPYYEPVPDDTLDISESAMIGPLNARGIGDLGISFYLNRLFIFTANHADGGSNRLTSWDLDQSPPVLVDDFENPYPPLTRHHIFSQGAFSRMNVDVDHRFPDDREEQCRVYLYATIWTFGPPAGVDCYVMRLDGDMNVLDEGSIWHPAYPGEFHDVPQCAIINDQGPSATANLIGHGWQSRTFYDWPVPVDW